MALQQVKDYSNKLTNQNVSQYITLLTEVYFSSIENKQVVGERQRDFPSGAFSVPVPSWCLLDLS